MFDIVVDQKTGFLITMLMYEGHSRINDSEPISQKVLDSVSYEPRREKTGLWDFRPGLTQTRLFSHKIWLEA